jgi:formylglycine-generating enzyme required for sulfatase activity
MQRSTVFRLLLPSLVTLTVAACFSSNGDTPSQVVGLPSGTDAAAVGTADSSPSSDGSSSSDSSQVDASDGSTLDFECSNGKVDTNETDVDCGGPKCPKCRDGSTCGAALDCSGGFCTGAKKCETPKCNDGAKNGQETDIDCGGAACPKCAVGRRCESATDCATSTCNTTDQACACPIRMVTVAKATGGAYCMDETEVTNGDYDKFVRANVPVGVGQPAGCTATDNPTFVPSNSWPPTQPLSKVDGYGWPVRYVDWCDAAAYCKWAGKVLCGTTDGKSVPVADFGVTSQNDAAKNAWFNACSAQGSKPPNGYPYGSAYDGARCYTSAAAGQVAEYADNGAYVSIPVDAARPLLRSCQGGVVGLYHMSGNVSEWTDSCDGSNPSSLCHVRGGSFNSGNASTCGVESIPARLTKSADIGIRCCQF